MHIEPIDIPASDEAVALRENARSSVDLMVDIVSDGLDHPELWTMIPQLVADNPLIVPELDQRLSRFEDVKQHVALQVLLAVVGAIMQPPLTIVDAMASLAADYSQSPLVQGVLFHLQRLADPDNPKYDLVGKICLSPFNQMDVLERSCHLCCASWLSTSVGNLAEAEWQDVWNSESAQAIRESIHDGSYRYCNKGACPTIQSNDLTPADTLSTRSPFWKSVVDDKLTELPVGPEVVNLAYDRTCNLSCPSCRVERYAADDATRRGYAEMQEKKILPMLKSARDVMITGSGDPFASKNFRQLMTDLTPEEYPDLRFRMMTNGMLLNRRQWESFPNLHHRVRTLKISTDAATGPTHELLRRGARWSVMLDNMAFAGELTAQGHVEHFDIVCTVQTENYREMGDIVDLAHQVGASGVCFARITNWGTFTPEEYRDKAVFLPSHPEYRQFLEQMRDPRMLDPIVQPTDLSDFARDADKFATSSEPMIATVV